jgi:hypothetical protein
MVGSTLSVEPALSDLWLASAKNLYLFFPISPISQRRSPSIQSGKSAIEGAMADKRFIVQVADDKFYKSAAPAGDPFSATQFDNPKDAGAIAKNNRGKLFFIEPKPQPQKKDESWVWVMWLMFFCIVLFRDANSVAMLQQLTRVDEPSRITTANPLPTNHSPYGMNF